MTPTKKTQIPSKLFTGVVVALSSLSCVAAEKHVHGHGELLIAKEGNEMQLQFSLPAADLLGFEHAPKTKSERMQRVRIQHILTKSQNVFTTDGACSVVSQETALPDLFLHSESDHDEHGEHHAHDENGEHQAHDEHGEHHAHDEHDEHHAHDDHDEHGEHERHTNIALDYQLQCAEDVASITVTLFNHAISLEAIEVQWISDKGQGISAVTATQPTLVW